MDGLELLRRLRQSADLPVIFLTSKDEEIDELMGSMPAQTTTSASPSRSGCCWSASRRFCGVAEGHKGGAAGPEGKKEVLIRGKLALRSAASRMHLGKKSRCG